MYFSSDFKLFHNISALCWYRTSMVFLFVPIQLFFLAIDCKFEVYDRLSLKSCLCYTRCYCGYLGVIYHLSFDFCQSSMFLHTAYFHHLFYIWTKFVNDNKGLITCLVIFLWSISLFGPTFYTCQWESVFNIQSDISFLIIIWCTLLAYFSGLIISYIGANWSTCTFFWKTGRMWEW